jgi:hypothetical protein
VRQLSPAADMSCHTPLAVMGHNRPSRAPSEAQEIRVRFDSELPAGWADFNGSVGTAGEHLEESHHIPPSATGVHHAQSVLEVGSTGATAAAVVGAVVAFLGAQTSAQGPTASTLKTNWGEPDLQGIWTDEFDTPLQRSAKYANQEFFTEAQRQELDNERSALIGRRVTEQGLAGAYNFAVFLTTKRTGARTSLIVDPVDGRIPPRTPQAQKAAAADREFHLALLQSTETCKKKALDCTGGRYDPTPSPRRVEPPPRYNNVRINRYDGPEDGSLADRCLTRGLPDFVNPFGGSFRRIVQTPGGVSIYYDVGQGQGWQRNIVMDASPHLPASIRQWYGDSRGHWEGPSSSTSRTSVRRPIF